MGDNDVEEEVSQYSYRGDGLLSMILSVDTDFGDGTFNLEEIALDVMIEERKL